MSHELHTSYEYESQTIAVFIHIAEQIKLRIYMYESQTVDVVTNYIRVMNMSHELHTELMNGSPSNYTSHTLYMRPESMSHHLFL